MPDWLLIEHASVLDGSGDPPSGPASVLVHGDTIERVGEVSAAEVPRGESLEIIDGTGKTLMPGLIDAHCHTTFGETYQQEEQDLYTSVEIRTLRAAWNLKKVLQAGVTGISDPGGSFFISVGLREGVRSNIVEGPRMFSAGRFISTSNGIADWYPTSVGVPDSGIGTVCNDPHAMVAEVRRQVKNGVDLIKIGDSPMGDYQAFMDSEIAIIADVAHTLNKRVTIHARGSANVDAAVKAGVDWIMHGNSMTDETIERLAESKIPLVPTLTLLGNLRDWGKLAGVPQAKIDAYDRILDKTAVTMHKAHDAGVTFITGTDSGFAVTPYGEWHARELELLMEIAGLSALEAIKAATSSAALRFAAKSADKFRGAPFREHTHSPPILADALAVLECERRDVITAGDHTILIGAVLRASCDTGQSAPGAALVHLARRFRSIAHEPVHGHDPGPDLPWFF